MTLQLHGPMGGAMAVGGGADAVRPTPMYAALDLGTNNCRLLIARAAPGGFRVVDAFSRIVRLGEGLSRSNHLTAPAMQRTLAALRVCGTKIRRRGIVAIRAVATEACRRAANCEEFLDSVAHETGIDIEIISAQEEARLALMGCSALLDRSVPNALVFDIGGGSTELMWLRVRSGRPPLLLDQISIPEGVVSLTEAFGGRRISPAAYAQMVRAIADGIAAFAARNRVDEAVRRGQVQLLGTSGTITTLAGIHLGLERYDRSRVDGTFLSVADARAVSRRLVELDFDGRAAHPCVGRERADLVVSGCAILEAICETFPAERMRVADRGLREGILVELIAAARAASRA